MNMKKTIAAIAAGSVAVSAMATTVSALENTELRYSLVENVWDNVETMGEAVITYTVDAVAVTAGTDLKLEIASPNFGDQAGIWNQLNKVTVVVDYNEASVTDRSFNFCGWNETGYVLSTTLGGSSTIDAEDVHVITLPGASLNTDTAATIKVIATWAHKGTDDNSIKAVVNTAKVSVDDGAYNPVYASLGAYTKYVPAGDLNKFVGFKPLKTTLNGAVYNGGSNNILNYLENVWVNGDQTKNSYNNVKLLLNDAIANYDSITFTFETAKDKVNEGTGLYDAVNGTDKYMSFNGNFWADYNNNVISDAWYGYNFFEGVLVVNGGYTMKLWDEQSFDWTGTSISFDWDTLTAGSMTDNDFANYLHSLDLVTSTDWYWDTMVVALADGTADDATSDAGADADEETLDDSNTDEEIIDGNDAVETPADETVETPEVSNPTTGNASVALAVIPVALAAAAVVAKKRN